MPSDPLTRGTFSPHEYSPSSYFANGKVGNVSTTDGRNSYSLPTLRELEVVHSLLQ